MINHGLLCFFSLHRSLRRLLWSLRRAATAAFLRGAPNAAAATAGEPAPFSDLEDVFETG